MSQANYRDSIDSDIFADRRSFKGYAIVAPSKPQSHRLSYQQSVYMQTAQKHSFLRHKKKTMIMQQKYRKQLMSLDTFA